MKYESIPIQVEAIQFHYDKDGLMELNQFTDYGVFRSGAKRTPNSGGWAYVRVPGCTEILIVDHGDYVVKYSNGAIKNLPEEEFVASFRLL